MKKLMIAAAIVCAAALSQAATVAWGSDSAVYGADGNKVGKNVTAYVYAITEAQYKSADTAWDLVGADITDNAGKGKAGSAGSNQMTSKINTFTTAGGDPNTDYFYAIVTTQGTGDDMMYIAEKVTLTTGEDGSASFMKVASAAYTADGAKTAWTAVPEPTSALLLMLGVAGLALKRRRA